MAPVLCGAVYVYFVDFFFSSIIRPSSSSWLWSTQLGELSIGESAAVFFGKAITSLMDDWSAQIMQSLSMPGAIPPCGGGENLKASSRKPNLYCATSSGILHIRKIHFCNSISWILIEPDASS